MNSGHRSVEDLTQAVNALFMAHSKRYRPPSPEDCRAVADALMAVRIRIDAVARRPRPDINPSRQGAHKSAVALWRHLKPLRRRLTGTFYETEEAGLDAEWVNTKLALLDAAVEAIESFLPILDEYPLTPSPEGSPIKYIAQKAQEAWAEANNGRWPKSNNPDDPLVRVVAGALALVNITRTVSTVSAVLKGKR